MGRIHVAGSRGDLSPGGVKIEAARARSAPPLLTQYRELKFALRYGLALRFAGQGSASFNSRR